MFHFRDLRDSLRPFARLHSPDEHEIFVQGLLSKFNQRIRNLKYYINNNIYRKTMLMLLLVFFQWKIFLRKKLSVYKNTDQKEFALEKVPVCRILKVKYNIHFPYQLSNICIDISAKNKMTCQGNVSYLDNDFHHPSHLIPLYLYISMHGAQSLQSAI